MKNSGEIVGGKAKLSRDSEDEIETYSPDFGKVLIMKGGGIKGLAYVGALRGLQNSFHFNHYVGTSAGAITAILGAAGFTPEELERELGNKNFRDFLDAPWFKWPTNFLFRRGIHPAQNFTNWMDDLLSEKFESPYRIKISDIQKRTGNRITIYASRKGQSALRFDSNDPALDAEAAYAARCSMSIPVVFTPQTHQGFLTFDGGIKNNFPVDELLRSDPNADFVGLFLGNRRYKDSSGGFLLGPLLSIVLDGGEMEVLREYEDRIVIIEPHPISTLDFSLSDEEKDFLLKTGHAEVQRFLGLEGWEDELHSVEEVRSEISIIRQKKKRRKRLYRFVILLIVMVVVPWLFCWWGSLGWENTLVRAEGMTTTFMCHKKFDVTNSGLSFQRKELKIDLSNWQYVAPESRDSELKSQCIQNYVIEATRISDDGKYYIQELASQRKRLDIELLSDQPYSVWRRVDENLATKSFKNVWTLVVNLEQHSVGNPIEIKYRVTRYNSYQAVTGNFVGHLVRAEVGEIDTTVILPNSKPLRSEPEILMRSIDSGKNEWIPFSGNGNVETSEDMTVFRWRMLGVPKESIYIAKFDWER